MQLTKSFFIKQQRPRGVTHIANRVFSAAAEYDLAVIGGGPGGNLRFN